MPAILTGQAPRQIISFSTMEGCSSGIAVYPAAPVTRYAQAHSTAPWQFASPCHSHGKIKSLLAEIDSMLAELLFYNETDSQNAWKSQFQLIFWLNDDVP